MVSVKLRARLFTKMIKILFLLCVLHFNLIPAHEPGKGSVPIVITTWRFVNATIAAWNELSTGSGTAVAAVVAGAAECEGEQCDGTVGYGGSPDENGETTLDALIMDGSTMDVGAVAALRRIKNAIGVARSVMDYTDHSLLVGDQATEFAKEMGFKEEILTTLHSKEMWLTWRNKNKCQPNFWTRDVSPDPTKSCGPYTPSRVPEPQIYVGPPVDRYHHDTIGMVAIDRDGNIAAGTSTNGAKFKIPGFLAVEEMRHGASPKDATETAMFRIIKHYPFFRGAIIAVNKTGHYWASCHGIPKFPYVVHHKDSDRKKFDPEVVKCV